MTYSGDGSYEGRNWSSQDDMWPVEDKPKDVNAN